MAHTALYGGTVYEKKGGADLVGGTVYKKDYGKVLVGGTAYEVGFAPSTAIVTITGYSGEYYASVSIDGTKYYSATTIEVPIGTVVECSAYTDDAVYLMARIYVNGEEVANSSKTFKNTVTYLYTVTCNATINLQETYKEQNGYKGYSTTVTIIEE